MGTSEGPSDPEEPANPEDPSDPEEPDDPEDPSDPEESSGPEDPSDAEDASDHEVESNLPFPLHDRLMSSENRKNLIKLLDTKPGLNAHQISRELGLNHDTVTFHLRRFAKHDVVQIEDSESEDDEKVCFLTKDAHLWEDPRTRILFGRSPLRKVGLYMAEHPGATSKDAAEAVKRSLPPVRRHLRTLLDHGLLQRLRTDRDVIYHATEILEAWVETAGSGYDRPWEQNDDDEDEAEDPSGS